MRTTRNAQDPHAPIVSQAREQLRRDEEVLARILLARDFHHAFVHQTLVAGIHALVDLVDDAEGCAGERLQGHEVEDGGDGTFAAGLTVGVEELEGFVFSVIVCKLGSYYGYGM